jgi:hypothetical protein
MAWMSPNVSRRRSLLLPDVAQASPSRMEGKIVTSSMGMSIKCDSGSAHENMSGASMVAYRSAPTPTP